MPGTKVSFLVGPRRRPLQALVRRCRETLTSRLDRARQTACRTRANRAGGQLHRSPARQRSRGLRTFDNDGHSRARRQAQSGAIAATTVRTDCTAHPSMRHWRRMSESRSVRKFVRQTTRPESRHKFACRTACLPGNSRIVGTVVGVAAAASFFPAAQYPQSEIGRPVSVSKIRQKVAIFSTSRSAAPPKRSHSWYPGAS